MSPSYHTQFCKIYIITTLSFSLLTLKLKIILFNRRIYIIVLFLKIQQKPYSWWLSQVSPGTTHTNSMKWRPQEVASTHQWAGKDRNCPKTQERWPSSQGRTLSSCPSCVQTPDPHWRPSAICQPVRQLSEDPPQIGSRRKRKGQKSDDPSYREKRVLRIFRISTFN
jgi:hypothetical protein